MKFTEMSYDTVTAKGYINTGNHPDKANDMVTFVRSQGSPYYFKDEFNSMRCEVDYFEKGKHCSKMVSHSGKVLFAQLYSEDDKELLVNGTGKNIRTESYGFLHEYYTDSLLTEGYEIRTTQRDTLYRSHEKMAEPYDGYEGFIKTFTQIIKYPALARVAGKQGVVYIQFIVDKRGKLTEFAPLSQEGYRLEKKVMEKLEQMPNWKPAVFRGKPVKVRCILPVRFKLT